MGKLGNLGFPESFQKAIDCARRHAVPTGESLDRRDNVWLPWPGERFEIGKEFEDFPR